jgi:polyhydroxyalkanoate synthesis regulator phasin
MKKKKIVSTLVGGALVLTLIIPSVSSASAVQNDCGDQDCQQRKGVHMKMQEFRGQGIGYRMDLDEETREKLQDIKEQLKEGTLTREEAREQMEELGLEMGRFHKELGRDLDEETREKLQDIKEQIKDGTLTKEEARAEMEELGIEMGRLKRAPRSHSDIGLGCFK